jgi:PhnB protein
MAKDAPPDWGEKVMHARLSIGGLAITGHDTFPENYVSPQGFSILLGMSDFADTERIFNDLAAGGTIRMPLQQTFWSPRFGSVTDQFGINWDLNYEKTEE